MLVSEQERKRGSKAYKVGPLSFGSRLNVAKLKTNELLEIGWLLRRLSGTIPDPFPGGAAPRVSCTARVAH